MEPKMAKGVVTGHSVFSRDMASSPLLLDAAKAPPPRVMVARCEKAVWVVGLSRAIINGGEVVVVLLRDRNVATTSCRLAGMEKPSDMARREEPRRIKMETNTVDRPISVVDNNSRLFFCLVEYQI